MRIAEATTILEPEGAMSISESIHMLSQATTSLEPEVGAMSNEQVEYVIEQMDALFTQLCKEAAQRNLN